MFPPLVKTVTELAAQTTKWQSMWMQVNTVTVADVQPDSNDQGEFTVKDAASGATTLRIGPKFFPKLVEQVRANLTTNQAITSIVGTQAYDFNESKLWPYDKGDFVGLP